MSTVNYAGQDTADLLHNGIKFGQRTSGSGRGVHLQSLIWHLV